MNFKQKRTNPDHPTATQTASVAFSGAVAALQLPSGRTLVVLGEQSGFPHRPLYVKSINENTGSHTPQFPVKLGVWSSPVPNIKWVVSHSLHSCPTSDCGFAPPANNPVVNVWFRTPSYAQI